jgi:predicted enzyme related to lactoylglutathione lyase
MAAGLGYYVLHVPNAVRGKAFYKAVLGWNAEPGDDPKRYYHVEGSQPAGGIAGGAGEPHVTVYFIVDDAKATVAAIRALGGQAPDPSQSASGWCAECTDDQGGPFAIWQPERSYAPDGPPKIGHGDLHYFLVRAKDDERAKRFYGKLFGWEFTAGSHPRGWNAHNLEPVGGLFGAGTSGPITVYFQVADIEDALDRVRKAGGTPGPVQPNAVGWHADCADDQGLAFSLGSLREG